MPTIPNTCPSCRGALEVRALGCRQCETRLEGRFALPPLLRLPEEELAFVERFVRASGSLKEMAKLEGQSYPTIRNRLNAIIQKLEDEAPPVEIRQHQVLDAIAKGELSVDEGVALLRKLES